MYGNALEMELTNFQIFGLSPEPWHIVQFVPASEKANPITGHFAVFPRSPPNITRAP